MTGSRGLRAVLLACTLVALPLSGCGLPTMTTPVAIDTPAPSPPVDTAQGSPPTAGGTAELFFVSGDHMLRAAPRRPVSGDQEQVIERTLAELVDGPTGPEQDSGLSSAFPPGLSLRLVRFSAGQAVVDLVGTDPGPAADQAHLATGQVVLTLTALPSVSSVMLTRNGRPLEAALPDGELTGLPLTAKDFAVLVRR